VSPDDGEQCQGTAEVLALTASVNAKAESASGVGKSEGQAEITAEDPRLASLRIKYEALSDADRTYKGKVLSWEEVIKAIPKVSQMLEGADSLQDVEPYWINEEGQLVLGDGCAEPAEETLDLSYKQSRTNAREVADRGLITLEEYERKNKGQFEKDKRIWVESGENPQVAKCAGWRNGKVSPSGYGAIGHSRRLGSRRVLRVNLTLES